MSNYNRTIAIKRLTVLTPHQFDTKFMLLPKRHGQCTSITMLHDIIIVYSSEKNAVFIVITEVTENLVKVRQTNFLHILVCVVLSHGQLSIVKPTDANKRN